MGLQPAIIGDKHEAASSKIKSEYPIFDVVDRVWTKFPRFRGDCSGYLKEVSRELGIPMWPGNANEIVKHLPNMNGWISLGKDPVRATALSRQGYYVVGGETESGHGHVVVIVPGWSATGHPMGYWRRLGSVGYANASLSKAWVGNASWNSDAGLAIYHHKNGAPSPLDEVLYFAYPSKTLAPAKTR